MPQRSEARNERIITATAVIVVLLGLTAFGIDVVQGDGVRWEAAMVAAAAVLVWAVNRPKSTSREA